MSSPVWVRRRRKRYDRQLLAQFRESFDPFDNGRLRYYDRQLKPISTAMWLYLGYQPDYKRVAFTRVGPGSVSTIWLGLDHSGFAGGPPFVFESLVQCPWESDLDQEIYRYPNETQARTGHASLVVALQGSRPWLTAAHGFGRALRVAERRTGPQIKVDPSS